MTSWLEVDRAFGAEPSVEWDRTMEACGWNPTLRIRDIGTNRELWADCPSCVGYRGQTSATRLSYNERLAACQCSRWSVDDGRWNPRISDGERSYLADLVAKYVLRTGQMTHATEPEVERILESIGCVDRASINTPRGGVVNVAIVLTDPSVAVGVEAIVRRVIALVAPAGTEIDHFIVIDGSSEHAQHGAR